MPTHHVQASIAIAHNLMIAASVGVVLACALWCGAPWLIQRARLGNVTWVQETACNLSTT